MTSRAHNAAPTLSRGRPALPVYRQGLTFSVCYQRVVDNSVAVDNSGAAAHGVLKGPFIASSVRKGPFSTPATTRTDRSRHRRFHTFANSNSGVAR
jgi:hypothetical protein